MNTAGTVIGRPVADTARTMGEGRLFIRRCIHLELPLVSRLRVQAPVLFGDCVGIESRVGEIGPDTVTVAM